LDFIYAAINKDIVAEMGWRNVVKMG